MKKLLIGICLLIGMSSKAQYILMIKIEKQDMVGSVWASPTNCPIARRLKRLFVKSLSINVQGKFVVVVTPYRNDSTVAEIFDIYTDIVEPFIYDGSSRELPWDMKYINNNCKLGYEPFDYCCDQDLFDRLEHFQRVIYLVQKERKVGKYY